MLQDFRDQLVTPIVSRYQKRTSFATLHLFWLFFICGWLGFLGWRNELKVGYAALPVLQVSPNTPSHLFLLPVIPSALRLTTHTQDLILSVQDGQIFLSTRAIYRLHNIGRENLSAPLQIAPVGGATLLPDRLTLSVDGQPVGLQPGATPGQQTTVISFTPDGRRMVALTYQMRLVGDSLTTVLYPLSALSAWPGVPESWRVTLTLPGETSGVFPSQSWIATQPDGWTYDGVKVQWLADGAPPAQVAWQAIDSTLWRAIGEARQSLAAQPSADQFLRLGDLYTQLYRAPEADESSRERFYAQALAAYGDGLSHAQSTDNEPQVKAPLHRALTALYRSRSVLADGSLDMGYVDLVVNEANAALTSFAADDQRRPEVTQWLAEGLRLQFQRAKQRQEWQRAAARLDDLAILPPGSVDLAWLASEREFVQLQQALTLLNQDNQEAAIALAGPAIVDESLLPRPENRALMASWQMTVTVGPGELHLEAVALPRPGRQSEAQQAAEGLRRAWEDVRAPGVSVSLADAQHVRIEVQSTALAQRVALAQAIPPLADWAILRSMLITLDPQIEQRARLLWQEVTITQPLDLRTVVDQWQGTGALLARQRYAESGDTSPGAALTAVQNQVRGQLFALYHQQEAQHWQELVQSSHVRVHMRSGPEGSPARTWLLPVNDAPQTLVFHAETLSLIRLGLLAIALMIFVLLLTAIFWLLL